MNKKEGEGKEGAEGDSPNKNQDDDELVKAVSPVKSTKKKDLSSAKKSEAQ